MSCIPAQCCTSCSVTADRATQGEAKREVDDAHVQLAVARNELRRAALIDTVTGTLTRCAFVEGVGLEFEKAEFGAVLMLDMDDLKHVNDEQEFVLVLPGAEAVPADARLRGVLARAPSLRVEPTGAQLPLRISVGSAGYTSAEDMAAANDSADAAMQRAKSGRKFGRSSGTVA